jgi:hypothetical protein
MTYCEKCRIKNGWPEREVIWLATCRVCGRRGPCYDTPSDELPPLTPGKIESGKKPDFKRKARHQKMLGEW